MKSHSITSEETLNMLEAMLEDIIKNNPTEGLFYSLVFYYGIKQDDLFQISPRDIFLNPFSKKYSDINVSTERYLNIVKGLEKNDAFKEVLPSRSLLYRRLNMAARKVGIYENISISTLHKTWAFVALKNGENVQIVMKHFNYHNSVYSFLFDFLGLSVDKCFNYGDALKYLFSSAVLKEASMCDSTNTPNDKLEFLYDAARQIAIRLFSTE